MKVERPRKLDMPVYGERMGMTLRAAAVEGAFKRIEVLMHAKRVLRKTEARSPLQEPISKLVIFARTLEARVKTTRCVEQLRGERNVSRTEILEAETVSEPAPRCKSAFPPIASCTRERIVTDRSEWNGEVAQDETIRMSGVLK